MLKNIASLAIKFFGASVSYFLTLYLSKVFGNEKLGYFSFLLSFSLIFLLVLKLGTDIYMMKWTSKFYSTGEPGKAKYLYFKLLSYHCLAGFVLTSIAIGITPFLIRTYFTNYTDYIYFQIGLAGVFFMNLHILNYEFLRGTRRVMSYTFYHTVSIFLFTVVFNLLLDLLSFNFEFKFVWCYLGAIVISFLVSFFEVISKIKNEKTVRIETLRINTVISDSIPFFSNNAVFVLIGTIDIFILSRYIMPASVGEYALILKIATFISFPLTVMSANFAPKIPGFSSKSKLIKEIKKNGKIIIVFASLIYGLIFLLFPSITSFLSLKSDKNLLIYAMIGLGFLISSLFALNEACLLMLGEEKLYQKIMLAACVINLILNLLLIPVWKELGAAFASLFTIASWNLAAAFYTRKKLQLPTGIINKI
ncbi:MAG: polysaccharide biosynthesis C-terminal domain-containing protein [Bacteroidota bacterium]